MARKPSIIGISAGYHDAACCLVQGGKLVAAMQEERFTRIKHDPQWPLRAFRACLARAGEDIQNIDCMAYYEDAALKATRQDPAVRSTAWCSPLDELRRLSGFEGRMTWYHHHRSHAASAFYGSGFDAAAVFTVDGVGELTTTAYWSAGPAGIELLEDVRYPHSLGLLYSTLTAYLGFSVNDSEYKVMGLAPYGRPRFVERLQQLIAIEPRGQFRLQMDYFEFQGGGATRMWSQRLEQLLGCPPRRPDEPLDEIHADLARSVQAILENVLLEKVRYLHERVPVDRLCMAGGVALNCVANGRIHREGPFRELFIQPAAGDAGGALGAAALAHVELAPDVPLELDMKHVFLGPEVAPSAIRHTLAQLPLSFDELAHEGDGAPLYEQVARDLADGRIVGWFQGPMEFGPRALGARSILADPRVPDMRDRVNRIIKQREAFRPFAPAVLVEHAAEHFDLAHESPFMLETAQVTSPLGLPAITHVDGSARVQTVSHDTAGRFWLLLRAFARITGCPMLLNTSFNLKDEPIVCSPEDALVCFLRSEIDLLVLGNCVVRRQSVAPGLIDAVRRSYVARKLGVSEHLYTLA